MINPLDTTTKVLELVSQKSGYTTEQLLGYSHEPQLMKARHVLVAVLRELGFSYQECAKWTNRSGHRAAQNSVMVVWQNEELKKDMETIVQEVKNGTAE